MMGIIEAARRAKATLWRAIAAMTRPMSRAFEEGGLFHSTANTLDLVEFREMLDMEKVEAFYEAYSELYPGQRVLYLPLEKVELILLSQPPMKSELILTERLPTYGRVVLSIRSLLGYRHSLCPLETIEFFR